MVLKQLILIDTNIWNSGEKKKQYRLFGTFQKFSFDIWLKVIGFSFNAVLVWILLYLTTLDATSINGDYSTVADLYHT